MAPRVIAPDGEAPSANPGMAVRVRAWLADQVLAQADRWRLWTPVAFGCGCAVYFALPIEPPVWPLLVFGALLVAALAWGWRRLGLAWLIPLTLVAFLASGLAIAKLRSDAVAAPIAPADAGIVGIEGWVVDVSSPGTRGARVVLAPTWIEGLDAEAIPHRLTVSLRGEAMRPDEAVSIRGVLNPPPEPASPGAFDFGRNAWFQSVGGTVLSISQPRPVILREPPWPLRLKMAINGMRFDLGRRIVERLGQPSGGIAAAMTTGHEAWIAEADEQAMRDSGLAHILSISGLHMAIVGGFVFFAIRLMVAAWPWLALRAPGKKIAALAGSLAVGIYLVVSGAPPPAERAAIVAWVAFAAILLDRRAVSMNALALAALIVLLRRPESVVQPGFQMSFAATAALVALAEAWPPRLKEISAPWPIVAFQRARSWLFVALMASLVAGLATGPFAMHHFNRSAVFGLAANLAVAPISSFVMMPALAVGAAMEAAGWGGPVLWLAGQSIDWMMGIGRFTANLPGAVVTVPSAPAVALPIAFLGILFVCLWRGRLRWLGLPFACAVLIWSRPPAPDLWIGPEGTNAALRAGDTVQVVRPNVRLFAVDLWTRRRGVEPASPELAERVCRRSWCALTSETGSAAIWFGRRAPDDAQLSELCAAGEVVAVRTPVTNLPTACDGRLVLDGRDLARGSVELWREGDGWRGVWTDDLRGERPWVQ
ncbi:ComEC/Rec2 family competence protein [Brevundimonas sp.]|uniref:ComEC/Rec2 family competence protein n=1 Tax=Brevundimonas sp. TaxID=1871086 RepID=UPI0025FD6EE4|nr:ComEC/Rec2 family competence protein [Brevundimonas sp.]